MPALNVSVHHYTAHDFAVARHRHELIRRDDIALNLDARQSGLGSASCGPGTLEKYLVPPEDTQFSVNLSPLRGEAFSLTASTGVRIERL
jgi:beta galactosidase small subunit